jgi:voltage-gated potassium channel
MVKHIVFRILAPPDAEAVDRTQPLRTREPGWVERWSHRFDVTIMTLIILSVIGVMLESVPLIAEQYGLALFTFEVVAVLVFSVEYVGRLWTCTLDKRFAGAVTGRLRWARSPLAIVDLLAVLPFYLPFLGVDARFLRVLRLLRILRLAKLQRYMKSLLLLGKVWSSRRYEIVMTTVLMLFILIISASLMYYAERGAQPEAFASIPHAMWWAIATLTTVGYGDVTPATGLGRVMGAVVAVVGIALFALPTGILGSGFVEELEKEREQERKKEERREQRNPQSGTSAGGGTLSCPHCGKALHLRAPEET